jgi:hypothetical protein
METQPPALSDVVTAAGGLRVAQRGADATGDADVRVVDVAPVAVPSGPPDEAISPHNGALWRRLWMLPDRLVIEFVGRVVVEVRDRDGSVVFDRAIPPDQEQHLLLDQVLPLVLARRGDIVLHSGVLTRGDRAVMLIGQSGAGKSTLTAYAGQQGWTIGGDDCAVVRPTTPVMVEPTYPTVRLTRDAAHLLGMPADVGSPVAGKRRLSDEGQRFSQEPAVLALIARLEPVAAGEPASFTKLRGAEAHTALLTSTVHADVRGGALFRHVLGGLVDVVETVTVGRLCVPRGRDGLADAERVLREAVAS